MAEAKKPPKSKTALLNDLRNSDDPVEKRKIRAALRKLGHSGGLGGKGGKAKAKKPVGRRAKKVEEEETEEAEA